MPRAPRSTSWNPRQRREAVPTDHQWVLCQRGNRRETVIENWPAEWGSPWFSLTGVVPLVVALVLFLRYRKGK